MATESQLSPMMAQYRRIRSELPVEAILLFRLGDFYEMFFEDAQAGAQLLNVALTKRGIVPMCGIPYHAANGYISKILQAGRKVAICDQVEEAKPGQLVRREITQILSPGTHFDERILAAERNNYICAIFPLGSRYGLAAVDLTTADFKATELPTSAVLLAELLRLRPAEIIYPESATAIENLLRGEFPVISAYEPWVFAAETAEFTLREHFKVLSLDGFGLKDAGAAVGAAGGILHYLTQHLRRNTVHLTRLSTYRHGEFLVLDSTSLRNLEVLEPARPDSSRRDSLFSALNRTVTPMGARRLREWLTQPLRALKPLRARQDAVQSWLDHLNLLSEFRAALGDVRDLERIISRLSAGSGNGRDLLALKGGLEQIPRLRALLEDLQAPFRMREDLALSGIGGEGISPQSLTAELRSNLSEVPDIVELIGRGIVEEPPLTIKEGGLIRDSFDPALDELRMATREGKQWIAQLQQKEIERTGISSLKIRFNSVFGYFIEITKSNLDRVPTEYLRKQTISNGERFITPALKEMEGKILGAEERSLKLEHEIFLQIREQVLERLKPIQETAQALAQLDVIAAFAETARLFRYTRPEIGEEGILSIIEGRHPVLDQAITEERFVPNDTLLNNGEQQIILITGPNMAGKSTFIRQVALLTLMAHTGSFIPATGARIDLVDRIFTRIGANDDLSRGQSTFMVEMTETANILNNATSKSLVILDEIGRGTSTFDGLSLAWSIVEFLHNQAGPKTLFATHYHELTELSGRLARVRNFNVAVREWNDQIIFLRKIVPGGTDKSYGIQVARLAGIPKRVLDRAKEILSNLEDAELAPEGKIKPSRQSPERDKLRKLKPTPQLDLFVNRSYG